MCADISLSGVTLGPQPLLESLTSTPFFPLIHSFPQRIHVLVARRAGQGSVVAFALY